MNRRTLLKSAVAGITLIATNGVVFAAGAVNYKDGIVKKALADGKTVFIDYATDWCTTCAAQERTINALRKANSAYDKIFFVRVDWDVYSNAPISKKYKIPRRSTLIVLKGDKELGRIVAGTSKTKIKALLDKGLDAATS